MYGLPSTNHCAYNVTNAPKLWFSSCLLHEKAGENSFKEMLRSQEQDRLQANWKVGEACFWWLLLSLFVFFPPFTATQPLVPHALMWGCHLWLC